MENVLRSFPFSTASLVPLGPPLMDTRVEVRDDDGHIVTEGEGQVFIGRTLVLPQYCMKKSYDN